MVAGGRFGAVHAVVTGGAGFIGSHLVRRLLQEGLRVTVMERPQAVLDNLEGLNVDIAFADIRSRSAVESRLPACEVLFHVAANPRLWAPDKRDFWRTNAEGTRNVIAAAEAKGVPRIIYTSTESIIGCSADGGAANEESEAREQDMVGRYCRSKFAGEQIALEAAHKGLDIVVVNPTVPVGPGDVNRGPLSNLIVNFLGGRIFGYMDCTINLVDVTAVADGHVLAWRRGLRGRRYFLGDEDLSVLQVLQMVGDLTGCAPPKLRVPYGVGLAFAYTAEFVSDYITRREPCATVTGVKLTRRMSRLDCSRARQELGFHAGDVKHALSQAIEWYAMRGWIPSRAARVRLAASQ